MDENAGRIVVGGMDAGIEDLLLDAGGEWLRDLASPRAAEVPPGPWVILMFGDGRATAGAVALRVCLDNGWPAEWSALGTGGSLRVQELVATRLLAVLSRKLVLPDGVAIRTSDLTPAQIRGIRKALPANASLVVDPPHERRPANRP